jgi:hypothetical protein
LHAVLLPLAVVMLAVLALLLCRLPLLKRHKQRFLGLGIGHFILLLEIKRSVTVPVVLQVPG